MLDKTRVTTTTTVRVTKRGFQIWIEGVKLSSHGFNAGTKYTLEMSEGLITCTIDSEGKKTVSRCSGGSRPIIDLHNKKIGKFFTPNSNLIVTFEQSIITIEEV